MAKSRPASAIRIRPLEPSDASALHELMLRDGVFPMTGQLPSLTLAEVTDKAAHRSLNRHGLVAVVGDRVVGLGGLDVSERARFRHVGELYVEVHDAFHRRGVGTALMKALLDLADRWLGLVRVQLEVNADNAAAVALYERFGFETEGRLRGNILRDGAYIDSLVMARLTPAPSYETKTKPPRTRQRRQGGRLETKSAIAR